MFFHTDQLRVATVAAACGALIAEYPHGLEVEYHERLRKVMKWFHEHHDAIPDRLEMAEVFLSLAEETIGEEL